MDESPAREECDGAKGLISEFETFVSEEKPSDDVLDVHAAFSALKAEHYEIVAYEALIKLAYQSGFNDAGATLKESMAEELATAEQLEDLSGKLIAQISK